MPVVVIDADGVGAGVADRCAEMGLNVVPVHSAERSEQPDLYYNIRAQMWWDCGQKFANGDIDLGCGREGRESDTTRYILEELKRQLCRVEYGQRNGKILVEKKDDVKARIGRSPDYADAYVMGIYGLQYAPTLEEATSAKDYGQREGRRRKRRKRGTALGV